ncbi:MAG TPA: hypothetical protein VMM55_02050, partial [Thermohalobaculum sp.]|nr:hypothetical protein [Thermohalobaculum sp.]
VADAAGAVSRESQPSSDTVEGVEAPVEPEPASAADRSAAPESQEDSGAEADAGAANLFAAEGDEDAGPGAAANLFDDPEPAVPEDDRPSPGASRADEEPVSTSAAAPPVDPDGENLFAAGPDPDAGTGGAVENLFGEPDAEERETGAGAEAAIEDAAFTSPEPQAADAPGDEEEAVGINLFDDDAPEEGAGDAGAQGAAPDGETTDDGAPIAPGTFRRLDRFNPRAPVEPEEEDLPPPRSYEDISAEELAKRAKAEAPAELMTAAAAWLTVVKGHGSFTKREVLELFEALPGNHPRTAEVKVKGFGRLVRNGQVKLGDDQRFRLAEAERDRYEALLE